MWTEWENWGGWGVCFVRGQLNPRGIRLLPLDKKYTREEAHEVAKRLNAKDPKAFKLLSQRRFI